MQASISPAVESRADRARPDALPSLMMRRRIAAPIERVFQAWCDPALIAAWWGCSATGAVPEAEADVRVGGTFRVVLLTDDGARHETKGTYREVVPPRQLVFTWKWSTRDDPESLVTVILRPDGEGTWLTLTHEYFADEPTRDLHIEGWSASLDRLVAHFA